MRFSLTLFIGLGIFSAFTLWLCEEKNPFRSYAPDVPGKFLAGIENYHEAMWVGTNSDSIGILLNEMVKSSEKRWIGGGILPDEHCRHDFYFDPNTVLIAESTVEGMQTTIHQISANPDSFASHGWSNGLTDHAWYVLGKFLEYRTNG
ncbi:MAG TPA: hypothetical protein VKA68_04990 [bacterium]|nr:hypothetical protein [bacterium]